VPEAELVARLGGDEFAVLLPPGTSTAEALETAEAVGRELEQPLPLRDLVITVQASIGIAVYPLDAVDPDTLLQRADVAMYQAKGAHSRVGVYAADRDEHSRDRLLLAEDLRRAVRSDELVLHYQPKADLPGGRVTGFEALVRWQRPGGQLLEPHEFLPLAEQTGLMPALTLRVLEQALRQCGRWADGGFELSVAVNVAAANLLDAGFPRDVADRLRASGVPADRLTLEISEDVVMADPQRTVDVLAQLGELGAHLSLDDFGTGRSSLAYIKRLPIEELKIDAGFVLGMTDDRADAAIVGSTVDLARNLGLRVVAEGVESVETWRELAALGCNVAQGFYLSRPLPAAAATRWLRRWPADEDGVGLPQPGRSPGVPRGRRAPS
jgi:predicted signal transduction protein with EAL and GGDEF domain